MTPTSASRGFTLIELLIVVVLIAILASIALPSYQNYIKRGHANTAAADLTALASSVENYFQRKLEYPSSLGDINTWSPASKTFTYEYESGGSADAYTLTANGAGCKLTLDHQNERTAEGSNCGGFSW